MNHPPVWMLYAAALLGVSPGHFYLWDFNRERLELSETGLRHMTEHGNVDIDLPELPSGTLFAPETSSFILPSRHNVRLDCDLLRHDEVSKAFNDWLSRNRIQMHYSPQYIQQRKLRHLRWKANRILTQ